MKQVEKDLHFYVLIRSRNAFPYLEKCLNSVLSQKYKTFTILFVDDDSEYTREQKKWIKTQLKDHICVFNQTRKYSLKNAFEMIHRYAVKKESVIVSLDGDDWFVDEFVLRYLNEIYSKNPDTELTYGDCLYYEPGTPHHLLAAKKYYPRMNLRYSDEVVRENWYGREVFFPLHPRTWRVEAFKQIPKERFLRSNGNWFQFCEDQAILYPLLEKAKGKFLALSKPLTFYNRENALNENKVDIVQCLIDEIEIRRKSIFSSRRKKDGGRSIKYELSYSNFFNLPMVGYFFYLLQLAKIFVSKGTDINHVFYASYKEKFFLSWIFHAGFSDFDVIVVSDLQFGKLLKYVRSKVVLSSNIWLPPVTPRNFQDYVYLFSRVEQVDLFSLKKVLVAQKLDAK